MNRRLLKIKKQLAKPAFFKISDEDFLKRIEKADEILNSCSLCPRKCGVNRNEGQIGFCRQGRNTSVSYYSVHKGEEPVICGGNGAGAVFFVGCTLSCVFCQNYQISQQSKKGDFKILTDTELADIFLNLQKMGACNIDLVSPVPHIPAILRGLFEARKLGLNIPIVFNTNSYISETALDLISDIVDIYLLDMKYFSDENSLKYSKVKSYPETVQNAVKSMFKSRGDLIYKDDLLAKGCIARILLLPNKAEEAEKTLSFLAENEIFIPISIMGQYNPVFNASKYPEICDFISQDRIESVVKFAEKLGFLDIWYQNVEANKIYLPDFTKANPFENV